VAASVSQARRKKKSSRRRYDIALNSQGAEMQLPALPRVSIGWRLLSGLMVLLLGAVIYFLWTTPLLQVMEMDVVGLTRLTKAELNSVVDVIGNSILMVDPEILEQDLQAAFPQLVNVTVETQVPNKVIVNLVERQPVTAWTQDGKVNWVDGEGVVFSPHGEWQPAINVIGESLPVIAPEENNTEQDEGERNLVLPKELVSAILTVSHEAPENTPIVYDSKLGIGWQDPSGWDVFFGTSTEDLDTKLRVYYKTWKRLKKAGIRPALINVEYIHAPYYRLER
jgi:cell division septal protein FtsQ